MLLNVVCFLSLGVCGWIVSLCSGCVGCCAFRPTRDACSCKCWCIGSTFVSPCRCCVSASRVHPAATPRAVFCTICSLSTSVSDASGDHTAEAYSSTGLAMALHVASMVSLCLPHPAEVRTFSMLTALRALVAARSMCLLQVSLGSSVSPSTLGRVVTGSVALST